jgi:DNA helicase-2/ATP-dependent DNA helicase PcrA
MKILNTEQLNAVHHSKGPLLIIAGAGTGKTTVITERIKYLILEKHVKPHEILALTFTEKAAREMEERVDIAMPYGYTQMWISTFHAFCDRILRNDAVQIGLTPGYHLMTQSESVKFFRDQLFHIHLNYFRPLGNPTKFVAGMLQHFSRLKDEDVSPEQYSSWVKKQTAANNRSTEKKQEVSKLHELATAYQYYEKLKAQEGVMDFSDLISNALDLFRKRSNILASYRSQFKHILVDEFQDTNIAQYELIKLLAPFKNNPNLAVVGDDSQSIYKFRGAAISNILSFMNDYKKAKQIVLNKNYRSTQTILDFSHKLIKYNNPDTLEAQMGISKKLEKMRSVEETEIKLLYTERVEDEAEKVAEEIQELMLPFAASDAASLKAKDFAILVRANSHADPFIRALKRRQIPYQFLGPGMLFRQEEVKNLIAYLKVLNNFEDSVSFYRVITMPIFNVNGRDIAALTNYAKKYNLSLFESAEQKCGFLKSSRDSQGNPEEQLAFIGSETEDSLKTIVLMIHRHLALLHKESAGQILFYFLEDTGLIKKLIDFTSTEQEKQAHNISLFFEKLKSYEANHEDASVKAVVDWIDLAMELGESPLANDMDWVENDAVNILTVHSSKGLEFPVVFLVNLITGRFPTYERREQIPIPDKIIKEVLPEGDFHVEEERRLFYVGMTRARDRLFLTAANYYGEGKRERKLSPFVSEAIGKSVVSRQSLVIGSKQLSFMEYGKNEDISDQRPTTNDQRPVTYLSYSQIETFKFCPMHYYARYILKLPTKEYAAQTFGKVMHQTMNMFYQKVKSGEKATSKLLFDIYDLLWNPIGYDSKQQEQQIRKLGKQELETYFKTQFDLKRLPSDLEKKFIFPIKKGLKFGGIIDRIDLLPNGKIEIIDYKTSDKIPTQKEVDKNLQLTMYALAATEVYEIGRKKEPKDIILSLFFFKDNVTVSTTRTREQLAQAQQEIIKIAEEIQQSDFACSGNTWCEKCEYKMLCG